MRYVVRLVYELDGRPDARDFLFERRRHAVSHAMRSLPYGSRLLRRPEVFPADAQTAALLTVKEADRT